MLQVDPLTHQVKLCDFGSAKVLVCVALPSLPFLYDRMMSTIIQEFINWHASLGCLMKPTKALFLPNADIKN